MKRQKGKLMLNNKEILGVFLGAFAVALTWGAMGIMLGRASVPRIQVLDHKTGQWTSITPEKNMKLYCFVPEGFTPCMQIFQDSDDVKQLIGPLIVVVPKESEQGADPSKPTPNRQRERSRLPGTASETALDTPLVID